MEDIIILGTGGNAIDIAEAVEASGHRVAGFLDDNPALWERQVGNWSVLGALGKAGNFAQAKFINGIGNPTNFWLKPEIIGRTRLPPERFANVVHPAAWVSPSAKLGRGVAILAHVSVSAGARIGDHVVVLPNAVISHDDVIGNYTCITSGACIAGNVTIGSCCYLGTNCSIRSNLRLGDRVLVGMGAVVLEDITANQTVIGAPARFLRHTVSLSLAAFLSQTVGEVRDGSPRGMPNS